MVTATTTLDRLQPNDGHRQPADVQQESDSDSRVSDQEEEEQQQQQHNERPLKCSAVHTLERDIPNFDYSHLVRQLRELILKEAAANEGLYSMAEIEKCRQDDWHLSRFLLRQKLDVDAAFEMLKAAMRFHHENLTNSIRPEDFPREFYELGGIFGYEPDRKGNRMLYMRVAFHRRTPEIMSIVHAFIYLHIKQLDDLARGRGIAIVLDCSGAGLASADMDMLLFLISTLKSYFPKGLSYFLVHELPWLLKPFWHIAKVWVPDEHRQLVKFSDSRTIFEYVERENLPDFMGGTCSRPYRQPPPNCTKLTEAAKLWGIPKRAAESVVNKFAPNLLPETLERLRRDMIEMDELDDAIKYDNLLD